MAPSSPRRWFLALAAPLLLLGAWLRAGTAPWHTNLWAIDWLSYYEPQAEALASLHLWRWAGSWEGLHPPFSGVVHGTLMTLGAGLGVQWAATVIAGLVAAALVGWLVLQAGRDAEAHPAVAVGAALSAVAVMALSPFQANYGLNTSPYPWALLMTAGAMAALWSARRSGEPRPWVVAGVLAGLAIQTHVLAFAVVIGQGCWLALQGRALWRDARAGLVRWAAIVGLFALPMIVGSLLKTSDPWTFHIDPQEEPWWRTAAMVLSERFGDRDSAVTLGGLLGGLALVGVARRPQGAAALLAWGVLGWMAALLLFIQLRVADPRLSHYYLVPQLLGVGAALAAAVELPRRRGLAALALGAVLLAQLPWGAQALDYLAERRQQASGLLEEHAAGREAVAAVFDEADEGAVIAYLWDHEFLNDEPEHLDPYAAFPLSVVGRRCPEEHPPRGLCNADGSRRYTFDPSAFTGEVAEYEEPLRLLINGSEPPGRTTIIQVPGSGAPERPFPVEEWLREHGAELLEEQGVLIWRFPPGHRVAPP